MPSLWSPRYLCPRVAVGGAISAPPAAPGPVRRNHDDGSVHLAHRVLPVPGPLPRLLNDDACEVRRSRIATLGRTSMRPITCAPAAPRPAVATFAIVDPRGRTSHHARPKPFAAQASGDLRAWARPPPTNDSSGDRVSVASSNDAVGAVRSVRFRPHRLRTGGDPLRCRLLPVARRTAHTPGPPDTA